MNGTGLMSFMSPMAIERQRGRAYIRQSLLAQGPPDAAALAAWEAAAGTGSADGVTAIIIVGGFIAQRPSMEMAFFGGTATTRVAAQFKGALRDPAVKAIVLDVDSPGGSVYGTPELADLIYSSRGQKPIVAVADSLAASAAYWIASAADEIVVTPSGEIGSVGVYSMHEDISEMAKQLGVSVEFISAGKGKTDGNPFAPLSDEARADMQGRVNDYYGMFVGAVARGRDIGKAQITDGWGARVVGAREAVELKMADRVGTLEETLARLSSGPGRASAMRKRAEGDGGPVFCDSPERECGCQPCWNDHPEACTALESVAASVEIRRRRGAARR